MALRELALRQVTQAVDRNLDTYLKAKKLIKTGAYESELPFLSAPIQPRNS